MSEERGTGNSTLVMSHRVRDRRKQKVPGRNLPSFVGTSIPGRQFLNLSLQVFAPLSVCSLFREFVSFNDVNLLLIFSTSTPPTLPSAADSSPRPSL